MKYLSFSRLALALVMALATQSASAALVNINFDSFNTSGGPVTGAPVANYLAGYGVTTSNLTPGSWLSVDKGGGWLSVPSSPNAFTLQGPTPWGSSFTLNFTGTVSDFSLTRVGFLGAGSPTGNILGPWSATAYDAAHTLLGTVSEPLFSAFGDIPMQTFTLGYSGISSITFYGNALGFAGVQMPYMDNFTFTTAVPEPATYTLLLVGFGLIGFTALKQKAVTS